jgi:DNA topoisomerase-1
MNHSLYLTDPGIYKKGGNWYYNHTGLRVTDTERLSKLGVPPSWRNVWYASSKKCHIQAHGIDLQGKKQYILSEEWIHNAKFEKYSRMKKFVKDLPKFTRKIQDLHNPLHLLCNLLLDTHIRVGNEIYAQQNKTYGLTTLRQKHVIQQNGKMYFSFTGKSNMDHTIEIPIKYIPFIKKYITSSKPNTILFCKDSGKEISSEELNVFIKQHMGNEYTCKDFRTYSANVLFIKAFLKNSKSIQNPKKCVLVSIDSTANHLGHTRSISRKSYISERLIDYCIDSFETASTLKASQLLEKL